MTEYASPLIKYGLPFLEIKILIETQLLTYNMKNDELCEEIHVHFVKALNYLMPTHSTTRPGKIIYFFNTPI